MPDPEALALCSEPLMNEVLETGAASPETVVTAIARRQVFPVFSARRCGWTGWTACCAGCRR